MDFIYEPERIIIKNEENKIVTCSYAQVWAKRHEKEYGHVFTE